MALGTMTSLSSFSIKEAGLYIDRVTLVGDGAYPTGGSAGVKALLNALTKDGRTPFACIVENGAAKKPEYDVTNDKLRLRVESTGAEVSNTTDCSADTYTLCFLSK